MISIVDPDSLAQDCQAIFPVCPLFYSILEPAYNAALESLEML